MRTILFITYIILFVSCDNATDNNSLNRNSDLDNITFIIDLKVNEETNEDLDTFIQEITDKVLNTEDFCLEYAYYVSEDRKSVTLYEKYIDSKSGVIHGQNFMSGPFFDRFFNLFTLEKFIVTGPATDEFKKFTSENGFIIEYRESVDGFIR
jgi:quinol monooxygenase YgiN